MIIDQFRPEEPEEEATIGRVLVQENPHGYGRVYSAMNRPAQCGISNVTSSDEESQSDDTSGSHPLPPPPVSAEDLLEAIPQLETTTRRMDSGGMGATVSQKSFDSGGSVPGTPDEFGSTSQVTVLHRHLLGYATSGSPSSGAILSDSEAPHPEAQAELQRPASPVRKSSSDADDDNESDKEIMVQFPPWPQVINQPLR